jgi:hypothetical protein
LAFSRVHGNMRVWDVSVAKYASGIASATNSLPKVPLQARDAHAAPVVTHVWRFVTKR